jgi:hypothetical protein
VKRLPTWSAACGREPTGTGDRARFRSSGNPGSARTAPIGRERNAADHSPSVGRASARDLSDRVRRGSRASCHDQSAKDGSPTDPNAAGHFLPHPCLHPGVPRVGDLPDTYLLWDGHDFVTGTAGMTTSGSGGWAPSIVSGSVLGTAKTGALIRADTFAPASSAVLLGSQARSIQPSADLRAAALCVCSTNPPVRFDVAGAADGAMQRLVRYRQPKGTETDRPSCTPPRRLPARGVLRGGTG